MMKRTRPTFNVSPVEVNDVDGALLVDSLLRFIWKKRRFSTKNSLLYKDAKIYGTGFAKGFWNPVINDVDMAILNPINVYPDEYATSVEDARYIHIVYRKPKDEIKMKYGVQIKEKSAIVYESWYAKGVLDDKDGYCIIWTDEMILKKIPLAKITKDSRIPIIAVRNSMTANRFWGTSQVAELGDLQLLHNKTVGLILDAMLINNSGRIITTDDALKVTNNPLDIIQKQPGTEVTVMPPIPVNPALFEIVGLTGYGAAQQLTDIYSMQALSKHRTATGLLSLQNETTTQSDADVEILSEEMSKMALILLNIVDKTYTTADYRRVLGNKADINKVKNITNYDVVVDLSSDLPSDKSSKLNLLMQMIQLKIITPDVLIKMLNIPELNAVVQDTAKKNEDTKKLIEMLGSQTQQNTNKQDAPTDIPPDEGAPQDIPEGVNNGNNGQ